MAITPICPDTAPPYRRASPLQVHRFLQRLDTSAISDPRCKQLKPIPICTAVRAVLSSDAMDIKRGHQWTSSDNVYDAEPKELQAPNPQPLPLKTRRIRKNRIFKKPPPQPRDSDSKNEDSFIFAAVETPTYQQSPLVHQLVRNPL